MVVLSDGSVITIGDRYETSTFERTGYLLKVDADGNEEWNRQLSSNDNLYGTSICQLPNGNVFIAGYDYDVPNTDFGIVVAEYNESNGLPVYQITHEFLQNAQAKDAVPMDDNGAIVLSTYETTNDSKILLVRFNANGDTVWTKTVDPFGGEETPSKMILISDGIIISGSVHTGSTDNVFIAKVDLDANLLWQWEFETTGLGFAEGLVPIPSGGFYLTGTASGVGFAELQILAGKFHPTGISDWITDFGGSRNDLGYGIDVMPEGGAIITGSHYKSDTSNFRDLTLIRVDTDGEEIWTRFFGDVGAETGYRVIVDGDQIVACGKADVNGSEDIVILRADFDGNVGVGIDDVSAAQNWLVFPNPFTDQINLSFTADPSSTHQIAILNAMGAKVLTTNAKGRATISTKDLPAGVYFVQVNGQFSSKMLKLQ